MRSLVFFFLLYLCASAAAGERSVIIEGFCVALAGRSRGPGLPRPCLSCGSWPARRPGNDGAASQRETVNLSAAAAERADAPKTRLHCDLTCPLPHHLHLHGAFTHRRSSPHLASPSALARIRVRPLLLSPSALTTSLRSPVFPPLHSRLPLGSAFLSSSLHSETLAARRLPQIRGTRESHTRPNFFTCRALD